MRKELAAAKKELTSIKASLKESAKREKVLRTIAADIGRIQKISARMVTITSKKPASNKATRKKAA